MADEEPWLSLSEAAQRSGLAREAIRAKARRGHIPARKGNNGQILVQLPAVLLAGSGRGEAGAQADLLADLLAEVAERREQVARTEAERDAAESVAEAQVEAARTAAMARVEAAKLEVAAVRELADRLTRELVEARRPWWRRLLG